MITHGKASTYRNYGCRCALCKKANTDYSRERRAFRRLNPKNWSHGKDTTYRNYACRCVECTEAHRVYKAKARIAKKDAEVDDAVEYEKRHGVCDCCSKFSSRLVFDHDHKTGAYRGYLCDSCNTGLGKLGDSVEGLTQALNYLQKAQTLVN